MSALSEYEGAHEAPTTPDLSVVAQKRASRDQALTAFPSVAWGELVRANMVSQDDVDLLQRVERSVPAAAEHAEEDPSVVALRNVLGEEEGVAAAVAGALTRLLGVAGNAVVTAYAVTRIVDVLELSAGANAAAFPAEAGAALLRVLKNAARAHVVQQAARALGLLAAQGVGDEAGALVHWCVQALSGAARSSSPESLSAVSALSALLRNVDAREEFVGQNGVRLLATALEQASNPQEQYEAALCLWALTFSESAWPAFVDALPMLCTTVCNPARHKVLRVAVAALANLAGKEDYTSRMIDAGLITTLSNLRAREWDDEDIAHDIREVHLACLSEFKELSSFEQLKKEVRSGELRWSTVLHTTKFWRENYRAAEEHDFAVIKRLVELLDGDDAEIVAIACFDLGEFARFYPNSKSLLQSLGAKAKAMNLLNHPDADVQKHALAATSKMLLTSWSFVTPAKGS